ncbi:bifunctional aminoglycoside phosphotransferase/ATP-binding protein [Adhaeretor mobilis]|uniref:Zeta toxin n=1 Tax=Adhaeretor mobilis TaxID=1930276 RepID=A0A517MZN2_9BACT|nr:AAA family ATPase [Adhaeretor mobilis]QDT00258.1 Zeta toxin [Adhaeretor mobilis]
MLSIDDTKKQYESDDLVALLSNPQTYSDGTNQAELIETHISWLFLTDRYVYKLKKPVKFEFLDFTSLQARQRACEEEVRINKRLAYQVYFGVLPITVEQTGELVLGGEGRPIDYVVKMRRLPSKLALDTTLRQDQFSAHKLNELVSYLVSFYCNLPPQVLQPEEYYERTVRHCHSNLQDLLSAADPLHHPIIRRIHNAQLLFAWLQKDLLLNRARDGRIVEGHGDLRAEHIFLETPPAVIDGLEFSEELRKNDVLDELCFLAMDCTRLGNSEIGAKLLDAYAKLSGDASPPELQDFYKSYRASVRAKVALLGVSQANGQARKHRLREFHQVLQWADHYAARIGGPYLFVIGGLMGTGKSTLATAVAEKTAAQVISTDAVRLTLFGASDKPSDFGKGTYRPELRQKVYEEMFATAEEALDFGQTVVLDGTFLTNGLREQATKLAHKHGATPIHIECECPIEAARLRVIERIKELESKSEGRPELIQQQVAEREELSESHGCLTIDSTHPMGMMLDRIAEKLAEPLIDVSRHDDILA